MLDMIVQSNLRATMWSASPSHDMLIKDTHAYEGEVNYSSIGATMISFTIFHTILKFCDKKQRETV